MEIKKGAVVKAIAGRDNNGYFVVTGTDKGYALIADGKSRKLGSPKRKNLKHLRFTNNIIELNDITDKKLRNVLSDFTHTP